MENNIKEQESAQSADFVEVLELAAEAGHILLENGAEISRVEDIMGRIASHFGVDSGNFFVLSNGIFTTGHANKVAKSGGQASTYANVEFIPIRGIQLSKVVAVNRLSYDIATGQTDLVEARTRLDAIRRSPAKPSWEQTLGSGIGAAGFCAVFGGGGPPGGGSPFLLFLPPPPPHHPPPLPRGGGRKGGGGI